MNVQVQFKMQWIKALGHDPTPDPSQGTGQGPRITAEALWSFYVLLVAIYHNINQVHTQ